MAPVSNFERPLGAILLLIGVNVLGYFKDNFFEVIEKFLSLYDDFDDSDELESFWVAITKFNTNLPVDAEVKERVTKFLKYRWQVNRNNFLMTEQDEYHMD